VNHAPSPVAAPVRDVIDPEFDQVYLRHARGVYRHAIRVAQGNRQRAEDATQKAFLEAWRDWDRFRLLPPRRQLSWLSVCAHNGVIDSWRKDGAEHPVEVIPDQPTRETTEDLAVSKVVLERFWKGGIAMPERARRAAYLHWHEGWTKVGIADYLGVDRATVKRDLDAMRAIAQEQLEKEALGSRREP
jgi:RNA polymerase sigma-70 factor (ECF subfamily)